MKNHSLLKVSILSIFLVFLSAQTQAGEKRDKAQLQKALNQAEERSFMDQRNQKKRVETQNERRLSAYEQEDFEFKPAHKINSKRQHKKSNLKAVKLGKPDYSYEEVGEDHSGLNSLHAPVFEESEFEDIDQELKELREISSYNN